MFDKTTSLTLTLLGFAFFMLGTSSLCVVGAFESVERLWGLSRTSTALLVATFSAVLGLFAPILQMLVGHWPRRRQILIGLSVMAAGSIGLALSPNQPILFAARFVMGLGAALTSPVVLALGSTIVPPALQGRALATVVMGMSVASVLGVPASTWMSNAVGVRWLFLLIGVLTVLSAGLIAVYVREDSSGIPLSRTQLLALIRRPATISGLSVIFFLTAGVFVTYTMIAPILRDHYGAGPKLITTALAIYGIAGLAGNLIVRQAATSYSAERLLTIAMLVLTGGFTVLLVLPISVGVLFVVLSIWPVMVDIVWPSQQRRIVELEPDFRGIALALNSSCLFLGLAFGSSLGGVAYPALGFAAVLGCSIGLTSFALVALIYSQRMRSTHIKPPGLVALHTHG
ncbi:MAG TPA: MFS transporter [Chthoniobacterales bacterium]